jgi:hypothetical protein
MLALAMKIIKKSVRKPLDDARLQLIAVQIEKGNLKQKRQSTNDEILQRRLSRTFVNQLLRAC